MHLSTVILALDLAGTFVFALSGGMAGVKRRLDLFGVLVVAFVAATSGGIARDLVIGSTPPAAVADWRYIAVTIPAGLVTFFWFGWIGRMNHAVLLFDGAGLALFAVSGATKALAFHLNPLAAALLGMLTGIGGGMARDLLVGEIPAVLRGDVYAVAALAGSAAVVLGDRLRLPQPVALATGAVLCFGLRLLAIYRGWRLPTSPALDPPGKEDGRQD